MGINLGEIITFTSQEIDALVASRILSLYEDGTRPIETPRDATKHEPERIVVQSHSGYLLSVKSISDDGSWELLITKEPEEES